MCIFSQVSVVSIIFGGHHEQNKLLVLWMITRFSANLVENLSIIWISIGLGVDYVASITFLVLKNGYTSVYVQFFNVMVLST